MRVQRLPLIAVGSLQHPDIDARQHNYSNVDITQVCKIHDSDLKAIPDGRQSTLAALREEYLVAWGRRSL